MCYYLFSEVLMRENELFRRTDETIARETLTGERALFRGKNLTINECIFDDGESPLKESENITVNTSLFRWKYPLWYSRNVQVNGCSFFDMARAGIWYTQDIRFADCMFEAPKALRRCRGVDLKNVSFSNAAETLWFCDGVSLENVVAKGDYFALGTDNVKARGLQLFGNYCFDGSKNVLIEDSRLLSKDSFWNSRNVTVRGCFISGEYLGWNAKGLVFENCTIESLQGLCYIDGLIMRNCRLINTTLAFEYSTVDADIAGGIDSVLNPCGGIIRAESIGELIIEKDKVDPSATKIIVR